MLFLNPEDFFQKVQSIAPLTREGELHYAKQMLLGEASAREALVQGYLPFVASLLRYRTNLHSLELILFQLYLLLICFLYCISLLYYH